MICALTHEECELKKSHIYPKFIWDFLKEKGGSRFRSVHAPTKIMQDGEKCFLLGNRAEQMFSLREKWFAEHIFIPFCNDAIMNTKVSYNDSLFYFIVSVLWRRFYTLMDNINDELKKQCMVALEEWRLFLLNGIIPPKYNQIYMMPVTPTLFFSPYFSFAKDYNVTIDDYRNDKNGFYPVTSYLLTDIESEIYCAPNNYAFFCKIPRFVFWAVIERNGTDQNYGIRVKPNGGTIDFKRYNIGNGEIKRFLFQRSYDAELLYKEASSKLSDKTLNKILGHMKRKENIEHLKNSETGELLLERVEYQSQFTE